MVSLTLNKERLFKDLGVKENEDVYHQLVMMGVEVDDVTKDEVVVDITPNRPDLLSQPGLTRALLAFMGKKPGLRMYSISKSKLKVKVDPSVQDVRPYTACAIAKGLKLDDERLRELIDIQEKMHVTFCRQRKRAAIGIYPMEAISGNITYKALPPEQIKFRPLESAKEMSAQQILTEHPKGKEYAHLLAGLQKYPIFVDSKGNVLSMPPIINSHQTGKVTTKTTEVFIEASGFDFRIVHEIVRIIACAFADLGAQIQSVEVVYARKSETTPDLSPSEQEFYSYYVNRRLGTSIKEEELPALLGRMGLGFRDGRIRETHHALVPPYRVDFLHPIDVVEDIAIAYGYENIRAELPKVATIARESPTTLFADHVRRIVAGLGILEAKNYHLIGRDLQRAFGHDSIVTLKSSVSAEYDSLRASLLPGLVQTLQRNKVHEYPQRLFEIGRVFAPREHSVDETERVALVIAGEADYTRIRQYLDALLAQLGKSATYTPIEDGRFLQGRVARVTLGEKEIGIVGELHPSVLKEINIPLAAFELDLRSLV